MMRLCRNKSFEETVNSAATQRLKINLNTTKKKTVGTNKGVFIMYFDTDLTIKEAN
jgi:hypothetical protein